MIPPIAEEQCCTIKEEYFLQATLNIRYRMERDLVHLLVYARGPRTDATTTSCVLRKQHSQHRPCQAGTEVKRGSRRCTQAARISAQAAY